MSLDALYWSASIFLWLCLTGIGIPPVPEEAGILYAASVTALHPEVRWWMAWPAASLGIIAADLLLYGVGRLWGERVLGHRWMQRIFATERRQRLEERFRRHGLKFLLLARLLPPLRTGVFVIAGSMRYPLSRFLLADAIYGVVGVGLVFFGGTVLLSLVHGLGNWLYVGLALIVAGYLLFRYYRYLRKLEVQATLKVADVVEVVEPELAGGEVGNGEGHERAPSSSSESGTSGASRGQESGSGPPCETR